MDPTNIIAIAMMAVMAATFVDGVGAFQLVKVLQKKGDAACVSSFQPIPPDSRARGRVSFFFILCCRRYEKRSYFRVLYIKYGVHLSRLVLVDILREPMHIQTVDVLHF